MEKPTFILQTTRAGRLPTNALFADEGTARAEADRAKDSGAFEHIKLVHMLAGEKITLLELGKPGPAPTRGKQGKPGPAKPKGKQVTGTQLVNRISLLITAVLIGGVLLYAVDYFLTK